MSIDDCPHAKDCSGCVIKQLRLQTYDSAKRFFLGIGVENYELIESISTGWRTRAKLAVRCGKNRLNIGLFRCRSHEVVCIPQCVAHHDSIRKIFEAIQTLPNNLGYDERSHSGDLRYVQITVERQTGCAQVVFVLNCDRSDEVRRRVWIDVARIVFENNMEILRSVYINYQKDVTNRICGEHFELICGEAFIHERILQSEIAISPSHFTQAHPAMFERLLADLIQSMDMKDRVIELYAGMGVISLVLAPFCSFLLAVEKEPSSQQAFDEAVSHLPDHMQAKVRFLVGDAGECLEFLEEYNAVIVDPPRKGLSERLIFLLQTTRNIEKVCYISCHFPSLQRDLQVLLQGGFRIDFARSYRFFPGTDHIETLVILRKTRDV